MTALLVAVASWLFYRVSSYVKDRKEWVDALNLLPGPSFDDMHPWLGHLAGLLETKGRVATHPELPDTVPFFTDLAHKYSKEGLFRFWSFHPYKIPIARGSVCIVDPYLVRKVFGERSAELIKDPRMYSISESLVGGSFLALSDGPEWKYQRRMIFPAFKSKFLEFANTTVLDLIDKHVVPLLTEDSNVLEWSLRLTAEVLGLVGFSHSFDSFEDNENSLYETYQTLLRTTAGRVMSPPFMLKVPTAENRRFWEAGRQLESVIRGVIKERLAHARPESKDILSYILDGSTPEELFGNTRMILFAGHDTTGTSLAWALWELAKHPEIQTKLFHLIEKLPPNPTYQELMHIPYLDAIVKETLRKYAPVGIARMTTGDFPITTKDGRKYTVPKNVTVYAFAMYTQRSTTFCENPNVFDPDRFLSSTPEAYFPFSLGPRNCIGQPLAMVEIKAVLAQVVRNYVISPAEGPEPQPVLYLTVKPDQLRLKFTKHE